MEIKWFGHAWFGVTIDGVRLVFDPLPPKYQKRLSAKVDLDTNVKADVILVSHSHSDHWGKEVIRSLQGPQTAIVSPRKPANKIGEDVNVVEAGEWLMLGKASVLAVPAYNLRKFYHRKGKGVGYLVTVAGMTIYHAGDTDFIPEMATLGKVDVAFLPIGGRFTMDVNEAALAARAIAPRLVVPMHNMSTKPTELARLLEDVPAIKVEAMEPGQTINFA
jgi:L-ascorbate metabolism protein UlaG (beta-lactamase superfamily)